MQLAALARQHGLAQWAALSKVLRGCSLALAGDQPDEAVAAIEDGMAACRAVGFNLHRPLFLGYLAEALLRRSDVAAAERVTAAPRRLTRPSREHADEPELLRLAGRLGGSRSPSEAEPFLRRAVDLAAAQGARLVELRAATSLARFWRERDRAREARELLAARLAPLTEGLDTAEAGAARAFPAGLAGRRGRAWWQVLFRRPRAAG